jgi:predicted DNA-binding transcriptional regulator YafY
MGPAILRQWLILSMLPKPPRRIDSATIEERLRDRGHVVHRRTIQRDLVQLSALFPIVSDERRKPFGWRWSESATSLGGALVIGDERGSRSLVVRLRVRDSSHVRVIEALGARGAEIDPASSVVTCTVDDGALTRRVFLGFAPSVEVLAPASLRREIGALAARAARLYADIE